MDKVLSFSAIIKKGDDLFVAHCLELDIVGVGKTADSAIDEMMDLVSAQIRYAFCHDNLDNLYHPAPPEIWQEYFACKNNVREVRREVFKNEDNNISDILLPDSVTTTTTECYHNTSYA